MDPLSIVENTERTRFCPQTDRWTAGRPAEVKSVYPSFNFVEAGDMIILIHENAFKYDVCNMAGILLEPVVMTNVETASAHTGPPPSYCPGVGVAKAPFVNYYLKNSILPK